MFLEIITWSQLYLNDAMSPIIENIIFFHEHAILIVILIIRFIIFLFVWIFISKLINLQLISGHLIEIVWTVVPIGLLFILAVPSLKILYLLDEVVNPIVTVKVLGNQWFWNYQYEDYNIDFDSVIKIDYENDNFRLLDVDNRLILPSKLEVRFLISSNDVIHSFTIPSLGFKVDAVPGRLNEVGVLIYYTGIFYGQCSEICGINHRFIPILIEVVNLKYFLNYLLWSN